MGPFSENEAATLLPFGAAIAFTVIGAISAVATFFLTFLGFVLPGMSKIAPKVSGYMIDANKENIQNVFRTVKDATAPTPEQDDETMFCHNCADKRSPKTPHSASTAAQNNNRTLHSNIKYPLAELILAYSLCAALNNLTSWQAHRVTCFNKQPIVITNSSSFMCKMGFNRQRLYCTNCKKFATNGTKILIVLCGVFIDTLFRLTSKAINIKITSKK